MSANKTFPLSPSLPAPPGNDPYLVALNKRLSDLLFMVAKRLNNTVHYGWRDIISSVSTARVPPASAPVADNFGPSGLRMEYRFAVNDYIFVGPFHINHDVKPSSPAYLHVHWSTNGTNTNTVKWQLDVMRAKGHDQEVFGAPVSYTVTGTPAGVAWKHMISEVSDGDALTVTEPDELILVTLKRVTNGGTDNTDQVFGLHVDIHYQTDREFTGFKAPDFYA